MRIAIVAGGPSSEAEVSRCSATGIEEALFAAGHHVVVLEADRELALRLTDARVDVVFPIAHGQLGEGGGVQGLLDVMQIPYVGAGVVASAVAMDKGVARLVLADAGIAVAKGRVVREAEASDLALAGELIASLGRSMVVKPACAGSAMGVTRFDATATEDGVRAALALARSHGPTVVVESLVRGAEITCGVLDPHGGSPRALTPIEIRTPGADYYDTRRRYSEGESEHLCPAPVSGARLAAIRDLALRAHTALGARDLSRVDFVLPANGAPVVLELNALPGFTPTSLYPEAARHDGISMAQLCDELVKGAALRGPTRFHAPIALPAQAKSPDAG